MKYKPQGEGFKTTPEAIKCGSTKISATAINYRYKKTVLWIRIRKDPKLFAGSGSIT
jgi:hypothetical protein